MNEATNALVQPTADSRQPTADSRQPTADAMRRNPWHKARDHAIESARRNALHECPYRDRRWRSYWLSEFEKAQQVKIDFAEKSA